MIEINLVPDVKQELIKARRIRATVISFAIIVTVVVGGLVGVMAGYVFGVQSVRHTVADQAIKDGAAQLAGVEDLSETLTIQNQLARIGELNDSKLINSRIFDVLSATIPAGENQIQISNLVLDSETGTLTLEGQAANGYSALEVFRKTIAAARIQYEVDGERQDDAVLATDVSTSNVSYGEDATGARVLRFTISFTYAPELFAVATQNPRVVIVENGNVTDSYLGIPRSLFGDRATDLEGGEQ